VHDNVTALEHHNGLALDVNIDKLSICEVSEPAAEARVTDAVSESRLVAPFSQLYHLNLAENKVYFGSSSSLLSYPQLSSFTL